VWAWYAERRQRLATVRPNAGHDALARLERWASGRGVEFLLVTQNVDGLHAAAGSERLVELHGNISPREVFSPHGHPAERWPEGATGPPRCSRCGSALRPDVVWFGEELPREAIEAALGATRLLRISS
jgi:NAD-dependent deacetylase